MPQPSCCWTTHKVRKACMMSRSTQWLTGFRGCFDSCCEMPIKTIGTVPHVHAAPKKPGCAQPKAGATPRIRAVPPDEHRPQFRVGSIYGPRAAVVPLQRHGNNPLQNTRLSLFPSSAVIVLRNLAIRNQPSAASCRAVRPVPPKCLLLPTSMKRTGPSRAAPR